MSNAALRAYFAKECNCELELTPNEKLLVAPPDEQEKDPLVASMLAQDKLEDIEAQTQQAINDSAEIAEIKSTLEESIGEITPVAVAIAAERLSSIYSRYNLPAARAKEDITALDPVSEATALIEQADTANDFVAAVAAEGIKEILTKISVNTRDAFKWVGAFTKDIQAVIKKAEATNGFPSATSEFTNAVRIAHFTDADRNQLTTASALEDHFRQSTAGLVATDTMLRDLAGLFRFFDRTDGVVKFEDAFAPFDRLAAPEGHAAPDGSKSLTSGIYGEDFIISNIPEGQSQTPTEFMTALAAIKIKHHRYWSVNDIKGTALRAMPAREVLNNSKELLKFASGMSHDYELIASITGSKMAGSLTGALGSRSMQLIAEFLSDPKLFSQYRSVASRLVTGLAKAANETVDGKAKALSCLLDYYKWSLSNHVDREVSEEGIFGAISGAVVFAGVIALGFLLGMVAPLMIVFFLLFAGGARLAKQAYTLQKDIDEVGEKLRKLRLTKNPAMADVLSMDDYKRLREAPLSEVIMGALGGGAFSVFYAAVKGSQIQELKKELKKLVDEYNTIVTSAESEARALRINEIYDTLSTADGKPVNETFETDAGEFSFKKWLSPRQIVTSFKEHLFPPGFVPVGEGSKNTVFGVYNGKLSLLDNGKVVQDVKGQKGVVESALRAAL